MLGTFRSLTSLPFPAEATILAAPIPSIERHKVAANGDGEPLILLSIDVEGQRRRLPPIRLQHLSVQYDVKCRVTAPDGGAVTDVFTIIACKGADRVVNEYFLRIMLPIVAKLGNNPSRAEINLAVSNVVELFRSLESPPRKSVQGLWAELFTIARASNKTLLVESWHSTPEDRFDFSNGAQRVEVKSCSRSPRRHHFSFEQLLPIADAETLIASVFVETAGGGTSLGELLESIRSDAEVSADHVIRIDEVVADTMGSSLRNALEARFDYQLATVTLAYYYSTDVPSVNQFVPPEVTNIKFISDISSCLPANMELLRSSGGLFAALA
jgi:hypothetical protein